MSTKRSAADDVPPYTNAINTAAKMQRYIVEATESIQRDTRGRDDAIYSAYGAGRPIREIARLVGISHTQVKNIVNRLAAAGETPHPDDADERFNEEVGGVGFPIFVDDSVHGAICGSANPV